jgi:hypothetical protein
MGTRLKFTLPGFMLSVVTTARLLIFTSKSAIDTVQALDGIWR